jgi:DDE superfamily endonuclease
MAAKRPYLQKRHAIERLFWCKEREDWTLEEWATVIFSDECSVQRGASKGQVWVWRTPSQKWDHDMIDAQKLGKQISIMIWGAIFLSGRSDLVVIERDEEAPREGYSARSYLTVLRDQIPRIYEPGKVFMQDGAAIHTARLITEWLEGEAIATLKWPVYSPDLNPIENLWAILKRMINERYPDLINMRASQAALEHFRDCINECWHDIPQEIIDSLIKSMDSRVNHVMAAKGWQTKY